MKDWWKSPEKGFKPASRTIPFQTMALTVAGLGVGLLQTGALFETDLQTVLSINSKSFNPADRRALFETERYDIRIVEIMPLQPGRPARPL